jgi:hypothetical protein
MPGRRTALWLILAATVVPSPALELGPAEVRSSLGEKLDARIPVRPREGEWFHAKCLSLAPEGIPGIAPLTGGTVSVERRRSSTDLRVRSAEPVNEPAIAFALTSSCAGAPQALGAPITLLIDPPRVDRAPRPADAVPPKAPPTPRATRPSAPESRARAAPPAGAVLDPAAERAAPPPAPPAQTPGSRPAADEPPAPAASRRASGEFVLRLSSGSIDLARTRQFDDKSRALLRERLRLLDSDDQVAEMLSMRDNLRRLEARVAELQLKLASVPPSFPAQRPGPPAAKELATPQSPAAVPAPVAPRKAEPAAPEVAAPAAPETAAKARTPDGPARIAPSPPPAQPPAEESMLDALQSFKGRIIGAAIAILVLLALLGAWLWSRWRHPPAREDEALAEEPGDVTAVMEPPEPAPVEDPIDIAAPARPAVSSDAALATRLGDDTEALRRRYLEERFPEVKAGSIVLDDPGSVVKGARLFYEDGALPRAVELLRFAVEDRPAELRPWLALFEIYRLERLPGEYGELAARFRERHGDTPQWAKVCSFGRELDPSNALYQEPPIKSLETIGPREARRMAAAHADPIAENWLEAPMDFENEVLATELRRSLMARARVDERDLVPNPMPALRSVEMFSVG